jgi:hypothetical protein
MVNTRSIARLGTLAVGLGIGAAWAHTPVASADTSTDWLSSVDSLVSGASPALVAPAVTDFQISFNGTDLFPTLGNEATATTVAGQFGLAIAFGNGASATAEGGTGNYALADGTNALANAGSLTSGATGNNYNIAEDIGNNPAGGAGAHDGAYAGAGSLIGATSSTGTDSNNSAYDFGNNGPDGALGGNSGVFAGDGQLIGEGGAGNGDTAYTAGNLSGNNDGSAAVAGNNDFASSSGAETGTNEGAFAALGNNNTAIADATYTISGDGVRATDGNGNYAYVFGPDNSTAAASGGNDIAYVSDPFSGATGPADSAVAGGGSFTNDLAEVLLAHGNATADTANLLYDIVSLFGNFSGTL